MKQTSKYKLNQWDKEDRILREDFNGDNGKLEAALAGIQAEVAQKGNCDMTLMTYTGTGSAEATRIVFERMPEAFFITGDLALVTGKGGQTDPLLICKDTSYSGSFVSTARAQWNGNTLLLDNSDVRYRMNTSGKAYWVLGLYKRA